MRAELTKAEQEAIRAFFGAKGIPQDAALTFNDVALPEQYSEIRSRSEIDNFDSELIQHSVHPLTLGIPLISANMESVTGPEMVIAIQREGGLGILPQSLPLKYRLEALERIQRSDCALIEDPITIEANTTIGTAKEEMARFNTNSLVVINKAHKPIGILSARDWLYEVNNETLVETLMTRNVITAISGSSFGQAKQILVDNKIEKLPLIDEVGRLAGLITARGLFYEKHHPRALRNSQGQFIRVGSIGVGRYFTPQHMSDVLAQLEKGVSALLIDTARAYSENTKEAIQNIRKSFPDLPLIVGNVSTPEGAKFLFDIGVNVVKVGIGPGQACTTRKVGIGIPQLTAVAQCGVVARSYKKTIIADGGIRNPGDVAKAIIAGANAVMVGSLFAGATESAAESYPITLKDLDADIMAKDYVGSASFEAQKTRMARQNLTHMRRPEGIKKIVPVFGPVKIRIDDILNGLRSAMSYIGARNLQELREKGNFIPQTRAGLVEGIDK